MRKVWECSLRWWLLRCLCLLLVSSILLLNTSIESNAQTTYNGTGLAGGATHSYNNSIQEDFGLTNLYTDVQAGHVYKLEIAIRYEMDFGNPMYWRNIAIRYGDIPLISVNDPDSGMGTASVHYVDRTVTVYMDSSQINGKSFNTSSRHIAQTNFGNFYFNSEFTFDVISCTALSAEETDQYNSGYKAGYSKGFEEGNNTGYSSGYEAGVDSVDTDAIYQSGFQAGVDSVDTDGLYNAGYNSGYSVGEAQGYEEGYNKGYDDAMERIASFGADTTEYPLHVASYNATNTHTTAYPMYLSPTDLIYTPYEFNFTSSDINPKYVYCLSGYVENFILYDNYSTFTDAEIFIDVGGIEYSIGIMQNSDTYYSPGFRVFIPGDRMSTHANIKVKVYGAYGEEEVTQYVYPYMNLLTESCILYLQNYGPINGTQQNAIANQTEILEGTLEEQKEIQQGQLEEQKEQTETQKGIWQSIKDFFGSFFDNLINSIIHVVVPTKEEMSELFDRLNDFFAETFGFLYYPFDFIIDAFNIFLEADSETGLTLPGFSIMGYEVWGNQTYDIASEPIVSTIFGYVRMGTGAMLAMWFVNYLRNFFDKRFGGGGN